MVKQIFVNLPVNDLEKSKAFWRALGFSFNPQFTDQNAAALVLGENIFVMLLVPEFFTRFTKKKLADAHTTTEVINAISVDNKKAVDELMKKVLAAGGTEVRPADDYGWMYSRSFQDPDGHQWEPLYMDMAKVPANPGASEKNN